MSCLLRPAGFRSASRSTKRTLFAVVAALVATTLLAPAAAAAPAARDFGPLIEEWPKYEGPASCMPRVQPGAYAMRDLILATYGKQTIGLLRACGSGAASSDHNEGRAVDWMLNAADPAQRALADDFLSWLLAPDAYGNQAANARRLGISYVIWDRQVWKAYRAADGWQPYTGASPHTDHIHISLTWRGADKETSWWTGTPDAIDSHWIRLGGAGFIGDPTGVRRTTSAGKGQDYTRGGIYLPIGGRAKAVNGAISLLYRARGAERSPLGYPLTDELRTPSRGGAYNHFQHGSIYWSAGTGAHDVTGAIRSKWASLGWEASPLGFPVTSQTPTPTRTGAFNHFEQGSIYWSPSTDVHEVRGAIRGKWSSMGWENGVLGFPTTDENGTSSRLGAYSHFENGSIYWSPQAGVHEVRGAIRGRWGQLGWENSGLGFPTSDETVVGAGRFSRFEGGLVHWSPVAGVSVVHGAVYARYVSLGSEASNLGMPITDERATPNHHGAYNHFENGSIYWSPHTGAQPVSGPIRDTWAAAGWENSRLGFPAGAPFPSAGGTRQNFQGGYVFVDAAGVATVSF